MAAGELKFQCLRCGNEYMDKYDPATEPQERACPKCMSNSVRPIKEKPGAKK